MNDRLRRYFESRRARSGWRRQLRRIVSQNRASALRDWWRGLLRSPGRSHSVVEDLCVKDRKETTLAEDIRGYVLSDDGSKVLVAQGPGYNLYDATPQGERSSKAVATTGLYVDRVPAEEWNQIFNEVWRRYRDWFYVSNMHGYDWVALREQYKPLLQVCGPSFGSQLRDQRNDCGADCAARVHRRR